MHAACKAKAPGSSHSCMTDDYIQSLSGLVSWRYGST